MTKKQMIRINENARRQPGADTSNTYAAKDSAPSRIRQFFGLRVKCWVCRILCGDSFFDRDASREIDRLVLANEILRAEGKR